MALPDVPCGEEEEVRGERRQRPIRRKDDAGKDDAPTRASAVAAAAAAGVQIEVK